MLYYQQPDASGHFGPYGGTFVAETLVHALHELEAAYARYRDDPEFGYRFLADEARQAGHDACDRTV